MSNILNYLEEQGNIPFSHSGFNEVDNLILSQIAYVDFDGIVPGIGTNEFITVKNASESFFATHSEDEMLLSKSLIKLSPFVLKEMAKGERFQNARLLNYISQLDETVPKQFAALHIELSDGTVYVAFRGTDDNLVSWQEDFNMSYKTVPAQIEAAEYLESTMQNSDKYFRVGGHSKGGNLAVYSAMKCLDSIKNRMIEIYDNDAPGFSKKILQSDEYDKISNKIIRITPEFSVIGMLLEHKGVHKIVGSNAKGIMQHDAMTWEVSENHFAYKERLAKKSCLLCKTISRWMNTLRTEQRKDIIKSLFDVLGAKGTKKVSDISDGKVTLFKTVKMIAKLNKATKFALIMLAFSFVIIYGKDLLNPLLSILSSNP